ncbi:selenium metabolism-associated LysR family transcriptional regulator [Paenibacillus alkalitolerans]|uniref:selenium metabolism-associated LysR family transcriptional regulator n=1 Tax=Paenibacillus alkalitolerans TaxID=2799335 RepID=UPI0018F3317E|nr:selenium metabolism-associated LysR family transcriptional regulator [Paenibacillus alkalitolerans]
MNFDHLNVFYAAATNRNFSETAKALHMSQPTVSQQIQQLEDTLHVKLFERTTRTIKLTQAGYILYRYAERIIQLVQSAEKELTVFSQTLHGDLDIGASTTIGEHVLPYLLGNFKRQYPSVLLRMRIGNSQTIVDQLLKNEIHLGFIEAPIFHPLLQHFPFLEDELVAVCSDGYEHPLLAKKESMALKDLRDIPLILREQGSGTRQIINESLQNVNFNPNELNVVMELGNTESVKAAVEAGIGITILSKSAILKELKLGTLRIVNVKGVRFKRYFYIVSDKNKAQTTAAYTFTDYILKRFDSES